VSARILAVDTTAEFGSIALGNEEVLLDAPEGFGGLIFDEIERLLRHAGRRLEDLDGFAAASGPGSFTGVRIGLACVKGLAEATGKAAFGISNLAVLARFGSAEKRVPIIDARRGEVYAGLYDARGNALAPEVVCPFPKLLAQLPQERVEFICQPLTAGPRSRSKGVADCAASPRVGVAVSGEDFAPFEGALAETPFAGCPVVTAPRALAAMVARMAIERLNAGECGDPAGLDANYVRRSDAELLFKPW
jgi:tRNA threonylcarbamoyladenosine biosynthesis protein TsaB